MAYLDTTGATSQQRMTAIGATGLVNAGLAAAVILGLATTYVPAPPSPNPTGTFIPEITLDPPPPDPKKIEEDIVEKKVTSEITVIDLPFDVPVRDPFESPVSDPSEDATPDPTGKDEENTQKKEDPIEDLPQDPPPPPPPSFTPKAPQPINSAAGWVTVNDYPRSDLNRGNEGTTRIALSVDARGRVTNCQITQSSGHTRLDRKTCAKAKQRARFDPATNENGETVAGIFSAAVRWQIPQ